MGEWNDPSVMKEGARMDPSELESKDWNWVVAVGLPEYSGKFQVVFDFTASRLGSSLGHLGSN